MDKPLTVSASNSTVSSSSSSSNCNAATITPNMDDNALLLTNRYDEYAGDATDAEYALDYYVPKRSFIARFPVAMDDFFRTVDDGVYSCLERIFLLPQCRPCSYWISVVVTSLTSVEIGVCLPLCLYLLQINDQLALWITMMMLITCIITQVFKRFVWRPRPWMLGRVQVISKTKTSAFPSRAVTISFVFGFIIALAINYSEGPRFDWHSDMIYLPLLFSVVSGIARIVLGAHYFSDCFFGVIAGATIVYISILLVPIHKGIITACPSCTTTVLSDSCYTSRKYAITATTLLSMANWKAFSLALTWIVAFCLFCIFDPLGFWSKSFQTLGTLLPCLLFHVTFLCPNHLGTVTSLGPRNPDGYKQFFVYALAASLIAFCMVFGIKVANKLYWPVRFVLLISYVVCVFFIIGFTRMLYA